MRSYGHFLESLLSLLHSFPLCPLPSLAFPTQMSLPSLFWPLHLQYFAPSPFLEIYLLEFINFLDHGSDDANGFVHVGTSLGQHWDRTWKIIGTICLRILCIWYGALIWNRQLLTFNSVRRTDICLLMPATEQNKWVNKMHFLAFSMYVSMSYLLFFVLLISKWNINSLIILKAFKYYFHS